jgi:hypothetical protein
MGFELQNIAALGRSIGSGPAVYVSSLFQLAGLVLVSPFLSLSALIKDRYGSLAAALVK